VPSFATLRLNWEPRIPSILRINGGELAIVYCFVLLYFCLAGGGERSLDRWRVSASAPSRLPRRA
jgi:hypothetical protein